MLQRFEFAVVRLDLTEIGQGLMIVRATVELQEVVRLASMVVTREELQLNTNLLLG